MSESKNQNQKRSLGQSKFVDRFIPLEYLTAGFDLRRRSRLLVIFSMALVIFGFCYALLYWLNYRVYSLAIMLAISSLFTATMPFVFLFTRSFLLASTQLLITYYVVLMTVTITNGGLHGAAIFWLASIPVIAMILHNIRHGIVWLLVCLASGSAVYLSSSFNFPNVLEPSMQERAKFLGYVGISILVPLLVSLFELAKNRMMLEMEAAKMEVEGLRKKSEEAHKNARLVLDSVSQGLIIVNFDGSMRKEVSRVLLDWFGQPEENQFFWEYLRKANENYSNWVEISWQQLNQGIFPPEIALRQMPRQMLRQMQSGDDQYLEFDFQVIEEDKAEHSHYVMVVVTSVTDRIKAELAEESRQEIMSVIEKLAKNRHFTCDILDEIQAIIDNLSSNKKSIEVERQLLHTLKGSSAIAGLLSISRLCNQLENRIFESRARLSSVDVKLLAVSWNALKEKLQPFLIFYNPENTIISNDEYRFLLKSIHDDLPKEKILDYLEGIKKEPIVDRFVMLAEHAKEIAMRVGKDGMEVDIEDNQIFLVEERWSLFWSSFIHAIRNAIDHGIEPVQEREKLGKMPSGRLIFRAEYLGEKLIISITDDGRGIDWEMIRSKAKENKLPHESQQDLAAMLFTDGFSTLDETTELSGRGIGMGALRQACETLGGSIEINSELHKGTQISFAFPKPHAIDSAA